MEEFISSSSSSSSLLQIAPMMNITNRHFRRFVRLLTKKTKLFTEMIVDNTILYNTHQLEKFIGGNSPEKLRLVSKYIEEFGYDEINLNIGCPSSKVVKGKFGASLMKEAELVRDIVYSIKREVQIPVTIKSRIGVDNFDSPEFLKNFIDVVSSAGCNHFIIHARIAKLKGIDTKKNRSIPPLNYNRVFWLCEHFPNLHFTLNGGIHTLEEASKLLNTTSSTTSISSDRRLLEGVMIGRAAADNSLLFSNADTFIFGEAEDPHTAVTRRTVYMEYCRYLEEQFTEPIPLYKTQLLIKPILSLFSNCMGNRFFRQSLDLQSRQSCYKNLLLPNELLVDCMQLMDTKYPTILDSPILSTE